MASPISSGLGGIGRSMKKVASPLIDKAAQVAKADDIKKVKVKVAIKKK